MIQKAIDILKGRWPEAVLVVGLFTGWLMLYGELVAGAQVAEQSKTELPFLPNFVMGVGVMMMFTICLMLWLGFLKTSVTDGNQPQQPGFLVRMGQPYFWRAFFFLFIYEFVCAVIISFVIVAVWLLWKADWTVTFETQIEQITKFIEASPHLTEILTLIAYAILIKPLLFIPARMVVFEQSPMQALGAMWKYRLNEINQIYALVGGGFAAVLTVLAISMLAPEKSIVYYVISVVYRLLFCGMMLFLMLLAVLWMQGHRGAEQAPLPQESE